MSRPLLGAVTLVAALLAGCSSAPQPPKDLGRDLAGKVGVDGMYAHLRKLQEIADANNHSRAEGTPGYDATVDYVAKTLRDKGFDVQTPEYEHLGQPSPGKPTLTVSGRAFPVDQASLLTSTPRGGLRAVTLRPDNPDGCSAADYAQRMTNAIAVVDDTGCSIVDKQNVAVAQGARGLIIVSKPGPDGSPRGLLPTGYYRALKVPVAVIDADADAALRRTSAPVLLTLDATAQMVKSRNVVAQTKTGDTRNVVMAGAHLDTVAASPGINDDGTGIAALLETAAALGSQPQVSNAVRFAFWGSEEASLAGSTKYVAGLDRDHLDDIALYLNFDMLGSPNAGYFTYDGDQSGQANPAVPADTVPTGSAGIERTLAGYLNLAGVRPADMPLGKVSDYSSFLTAGVPIGGVTTGGAQRKTELQARLWGGTAGVAFDRNYHLAGDTVDNVNRDALAVTGPSVAFAVGTYAQSIESANGVPPRDQRHRRAP
ncbi:M20/M25/M40 family metallo-hydrolase [Mycobacterium sp. 1274761.0]|uniref:M20/M25/M40 family metallo-hydrolase n=1 Tax=Mycobacterium sp. 1274761.0 TaxID=1834077 RepID=UPI000801C3DB|nr:M20/M25/M40 family metallo-hydrolase [Mycobacterium sp. 1274761.0]OBK70835.1 peptidase M28 [Mycobacterium sp. 1274761.0]